MRLSLAYRVCVFTSQTWCPAAWDLHIELNSIHAQYGMAHVSEQVPCRNNTSECRQLTQLSQLQFPPASQREDDKSC